MDTFENELTKLINKYTSEKPHKSPDYILAEFVQDCLAAHEKAVRKLNG